MLRRSSKSVQSLCAPSTLRFFSTSRITLANSRNPDADSNDDGSSLSSIVGDADPQYAPRNTEKTVHISGLPLSATKDKLQESLSSKGVEGVVRVFVPVNKYNQMARGYGFVEFDTVENANKARASGSADYEGHKLTFASSRSPTDAIKYKVYIGDLNYNTTETDLRSALSKFGELSHLSIAQEGGRSRGYAFATFATIEGADAAREAKTINIDDKIARIEKIFPRARPSGNFNQGGRGGYGSGSGGYQGSRDGGSGGYQGSRDGGSGGYQGSRDGGSRGGYGGSRDGGSGGYGSGRDGSSSGGSGGYGGSRDGGSGGYGSGRDGSSSGGYGGSNSS